MLAQEQARLLNHNYIGSEHILLALTAQDDSVAAAVLRRSGVTLKSARAEVEAVIGRGRSVPAGHIPFTPRAKKVLELSLAESLRLHDRIIRPEHILLGLLREGELQSDGVAIQVLERLGIDLAELGQAVIEATGSEGDEGEGGLSERLGSQRGMFRTAEPIVRCPGCDFEVTLVGAPHEVQVRIERASDDPRFRVYVTMIGVETLVHACGSEE